MVLSKICGMVIGMGFWVYVILTNRLPRCCLDLIDDAEGSMEGYFILRASQHLKSISRFTLN